MAGTIFINYRRDDSAGHADLLFIDVDAIPLGVNFIKVLRDEVAKCDVLLALIGPNWLNVRDEEGNRRLDNPSDFLRIEIAAALQRDIPVIPILLVGARMPKASQLPKDLEELSARNGLDVRGRRVGERSPARRRCNFKAECKVRHTCFNIPYIRFYPEEC
jgi:hypothetical protein